MNDEARLEAIKRIITDCDDEKAARFLYKMVEEGFVLAPIEPTPDMILAGRAEMESPTTDVPLGIYQAMLGASFPIAGGDDVG